MLYVFYLTWNGALMPQYRIEVLGQANYDEGEVAWRIEQALYRIPGLDQLDLTVTEAPL